MTPAHRHPMANCPPIQFVRQGPDEETQVTSIALQQLKAPAIEHAIRQHLPTSILQFHKAEPLQAGQKSFRSAVRHYMPAQELLPSAENIEVWRQRLPSPIAHLLTVASAVASHCAAIHVYGAATGPIGLATTVHTIGLQYLACRRPVVFARVAVIVGKQATSQAALITVASTAAAAANT